MPGMRLSRHDYLPRTRGDKPGAYDELSATITPTRTRGDKPGFANLNGGRAEPTPHTRG